MLASTDRRVNALNIYLTIYLGNLYCINRNMDHIIESQKMMAKILKPHLEEHYSSLLIIYLMDEGKYF